MAHWLQRCTLSWKSNLQGLVQHASQLQASGWTTPRGALGGSCGEVASSWPCPSTAGQCSYQSCFCPTQLSLSRSLCTWGWWQFYYRGTQVPVQPLQFPCPIHTFVISPFVNKTLNNYSNLNTSCLILEPWLIQSLVSEVVLGNSQNWIWDSFGHS